MPTDLPRLDEARPWRPDPALKGVALGLAALLVAWRPPTDLILPVVSLALLVSGFSLALLVLRLPSARSRALSGALVFLGFGAAILSDVRDLTPLLGGSTP